ncbi:hypothetical protein CERSUDRAFT_116201 [Gelatoporia subvermispora B]|uniref:RRM domain-containing protein n=1 Tax=Ceriporiopsis subvermispora (strain B) TaxID=914234 RepID=M2PHD3_CERS8|nr:hypothetical protein CERSUDRAFT_116201 [Gelatoporia subvermispora B]
MQVQPQHARLNTYHGTKRQLLGNQAGQAPPAWRVNQTAQAKKAVGSSAVDSGSKILLSRLPLDVSEDEVQVLFAKTVGPVKDVFLVYNSQGRSKGMAVVTFQRSADATVARTRYNGKIVDGKRPIKIEIIVDKDAPAQNALAVPQLPSLLARLGGVAVPTPSVKGAPSGNRAAVNGAAHPPKFQKAAGKAAAVPRAAAQPTTTKAKLRAKKGPKRVKKKTIAELDKEMEDYRATADTEMDAAS